MTIQNVVDAIGSKVNTISGWETGHRRVNLDDLSRLAGVYGVGPADLLHSPEGYEARHLAADFVRVAARLTAEQASHLLWIAEALIQASTGRTEPPGAPPTQSNGPTQAPPRSAADGETDAPEKLNNGSTRALARINPEPARVRADRAVGARVVTLASVRESGKK